MSSKDYEEQLALIVLAGLFPEEFGGLTRADMPDLQDPARQLGVEVVGAVDIADRELLGVIGDPRRRAPFAARLKKQRVIMSEGKYKVLLWPRREDSFALILRAFYHKVKKLNAGHYTPMAHNVLFVYSEILADLPALRTANDAMRELQRSYDTDFESVFVYVPGALYLLDLLTGENRILPIDTKAQTAWAILAGE